MNYGVYAPWDHAPKLLRQSDIREPLLPIKHFFDVDNVTGHEEKLKTWRSFVVNDKFYNDERFGPGSLVYDHELNVRLIEALYLLLLDYEEFSYRKKEIPKEQLALEKEEWDWFPSGLTENELLDPYIVIKAAFDEIKPQPFRDYLAEWLGAALSINSIDESFTAGEIITVYEHLKKMYSAAWLIYQRNSYGTQHKDKKMLESPAAAIDADSVKSVENEGSKIEPRILFKRNPDDGSSRAELLGLKEVSKLIRKTTPTVQLIVHIRTSRDPFIYYLLIIVDELGELTQDELAVKIEQDCASLVPTIAIVKKISWLTKASKNESGFFCYAFRKNRIIHQSPDIKLPEEYNGHFTQVEYELMETWEQWGVVGKESYDVALEDQLNKEYGGSLFMARMASEELIKALIALYTGYLPKTGNLERLLKISLLCTNRVYDIFHKDTDSSKRAFALLNSAGKDSMPRPDPIEETDLNLVMLNVQLLTMVAEEHYYGLLRDIAGGDCI